MVPLAVNQEEEEEVEATTMKLKPQTQVDEEKIIAIPRALQWIMAASSSFPPTMTIEEAISRSGVPRAWLWFAAAYMFALLIGVASFLANYFRTNDHIFPTSVPWRPPAIFAWGVYTALVMELFFFMALFLPRAPVAMQEAVVVIGVNCVGIPLMLIAALAASVGHTWMGVVLACVYAVVFTAVIALWIWLVRTYYTTT